MNREKVLKILWYIFLAAMSILTVLFFFDIKFMVIGINILAWDVLTAGIWIFVHLCKWAGRENTGRRTVAVITITLLGVFATVIVFFCLCIYDGIPFYVEQTEPQTHRTFVAEYQQNMMMRGNVSGSAPCCLPVIRMSILVNFRLSVLRTGGYMSARTANLLLLHISFCSQTLLFRWSSLLKQRKYLSRYWQNSLLMTPTMLFW